MAVYLVGGCVYQRNVMHQRGWRQLPNYAIWAGVGAFVRVGLPFSLALFPFMLLLPAKHASDIVCRGEGEEGMEGL